MSPPARKDAEMEADTIARIVEAMLFASDSPLTPSRIAQVGELRSQRPVKKAIEALNQRYDEVGCAFHIEEIAGGYQMMTRPEYHGVLRRLLQSRKDTRLSKAAMETLAIVAYRQPVIRADVEAIRGVACGDVLRGLMEKQMIKIMGRARVLGHPLLYGTTKRFLETFGLASLEDLPKVEDLRGGDKQPPPAEPQAAQEAEAPSSADAEGPPAEAPGPDQPATAAAEDDPEGAN